MYRTLLSLALALTFLIGCDSSGPERDYPRDQELHLNQIQNLGTHNSFHPAPDTGPIVEIIRRRFPYFIGQAEYRHLPLTEQMQDMGMRHFELDVFADPEGGNFSHRPMLAKLGEPTDRNIPALEEPGFKVLHLPQIDPDSTCWTLVACLEEIKAWSDRNSTHQPFMVMIETKDVDFMGLATYLPLARLSVEDYQALDDEILSVFPRSRLILPADVQGDFPSLEHAIKERGWPSLAESRGKVIFTHYHGHDPRDIKQRVMFPDSRPGDANAAFVVLEDSVTDFDRIQSLVKQGYLVRTRSDIDLQEAHDKDYTRFEKALASGAQFISTDIPQPYPDIDPDFYIVMENGRSSRCNPVTAPDWCQNEDIEHTPDKAASEGISAAQED